MKWRSGTCSWSKSPFSVPMSRPLCSLLFTSHRYQCNVRNHRRCRRLSWLRKQTRRRITSAIIQWHHRSVSRTSSSCCSSSVGFVCLAAECAFLIHFLGLAVCPPDAAYLFFSFRKYRIKPFLVHTTCLVPVSREVGHMGPVSPVVYRRWLVSRIKSLV